MASHLRLRITPSTACFFPGCPHLSRLSRARFGGPEYKKQGAVVQKMAFVKDYLCTHTSLFWSFTRPARPSSLLPRLCLRLCRGCFTALWRSLFITSNQIKAPLASYSVCIFDSCLAQPSALLSNRAGRELGRVTCSGRVSCATASVYIVDSKPLCQCLYC